MRIPAKNNFNFWKDVTAHHMEAVTTSY